MNEKRRITLVLENPNPLFEKWLTEWKEGAKERGSKMEKTFNYALSNLRKYKLPLASGRECRILKGFGEKLCKMLDDKLKDYGKSEENCPQVTTSKNKVGRLIQTSPKDYIPKPRSGGYAIILALYNSCNETNSSSLTKDEIINLGKHLSDCSFLNPDPGKYYTAWSSMRILLQKGLVIKQGKPIRYSLTEKGYSIAKKMPIGNIQVNQEIETRFSTFQKCLSIPEVSHTKTSIQNLEVVNLTENSDDEKCDQLSNEIDDYSDNLMSLNPKIDLPSIETLKRIIPQSSNLRISPDSLSHEKLYASSSCSSQNANINNYKFVKKIASASSVLQCKNSKDSTTEKCLSKGFKKYASCGSVQFSQGSAQEDCFIFEPNSFDVILYVDTQETTGSNTDIQDDPLLSKLQNSSVLYEVKHLNIGDYVWICRHRRLKKELVLPYIIERKRLDDFASSIKDGRYHEQKFRLKKSGIQNVTYLIEHFGKYVGLPLSTLHQAAANTAIQDGFNVKFTRNLRHTAHYLTMFSNLLYKNYKDKTLASCSKENLSELIITDDIGSLMTFSEFNKASSKNKPMKVSDLFIKMLLQIKGMSVEKACAVVEHYPTPALLKQAYELNTASQGEKLLAKITFGAYNKKIGCVLSQIVYGLFTKEKF